MITRVLPMNRLLRASLYGVLRTESVYSPRKSKSGETWGMYLLRHPS